MSLSSLPVKSLCFAFLCMLLLLACRRKEAAQPKPNVILILTDDQGYGDMSCHGNPWLKTPHLDELYHESTRLTDFHVDPTCSPTRAALMTGRYSTRTGVWLTYMGRHHLRSDELSMADLFKANGYRTGIFGKWHLGDNYPFRPGDRGFETSLIFGGGVVGEAPDYWGNDYYDDTYLHNGKEEQVVGYCTDVWFREAGKFIRDHKDQPFFLYLPTNAPHNPFHVPARYKDTYSGKEDIPEARASFYGMIANIDENIGRLRNLLEEEDLLEQTILIFLTDNGTAGGFSGSDGYNAGMRARKGSVFEGGHRAACFIRWPRGGIKEGKDLNALTAHVDLMPTLAGLCALNLTEGHPFDGMDLSGYLLDPEANKGPDRTLFVHHQGRFGQKVLDDRPVKYKDYAVMKGSWRRVGDQLFNLESDPGQRQDISPQHPDKMQAMGEAYEIWWKDVTRRSDEYARTIIGSDRQELTVLTCQGWHGEDVPYNQQHVRNGMVANGFWDLYVDTPGMYSIELRRWPREADAAMDAELAPERLDPEKHSLTFVLNQLPGTRTTIKTARLKVADFDQNVAVHPGQKKVQFRVNLPAGEVKLKSWLTDELGIQRGAYYIYINPITQ